MVEEVMTFLCGGCKNSTGIIQAEIANVTAVDEILKPFLHQQCCSLNYHILRNRQCHRAELTATVPFPDPPQLTLTNECHQSSNFKEYRARITAFNHIDKQYKSKITLLGQGGEDIPITANLEALKARNRTTGCTKLLYSYLKKLQC
ncbi:hypothetical protein DKX38_023212 [Salix brachista]|uniref:Uncharacterized protein n=1 Tax=Salix brachista TaxID=2182728 RepID=A0A5N5K662_9ROSI|nr:hypothetical protein DKX38_023212 [Salix brachista]